MATIENVDAKIAQRRLVFKAALEGIEREEGDFYAALMFRVISTLFPEKDPRAIADAVLNAYKEEGI